MHGGPLQRAWRCGSPAATPLTAPAALRVCVLKDGEYGDGVGRSDSNDRWPRTRASPRMHIG